jgi:glycosyltransferase involved in cell wall biosynthesis
MQPYGGISRYFTRVAENLLDMGQEARIFAPRHCNRYLESLTSGVVFGRYVRRFPPKTTRFVLAYNRFLFNRVHSGWSPDIVHETFYARYGSAPKGCATVVTVYDMINELFHDEIPMTDNTPKLKRLSIERSDAVICISENTKQDLMRILGTPENKISVVHLGFDKFVSKNYEVINENFVERPFLLYVGNRKGYKNFTSLLKAVASSSRLLADFDIISFGGPKFSSSEQRLIKSLGYSINQVKHKHGSDDALGFFYSKATAFVYPSLYEGFGIPTLEAMAHRCPVICSNASSIPEVVGLAASYFDPADIDEMKVAIENVVYSPSRMSQLRNLGSEQIKHFSWQKCAQETLDIYRTLV